MVHSVLGTAEAPPSPRGGYAIGLEQLAAVTRDHNLSAVREYGGASQY